MDEYTKNVTAKLPGIDPAIIQMIIAAIMQLVSICVPKPSSEKIINSNTPQAQRYRFRAMYQAGVRPASSQGRAIEAAMVGTTITPKCADEFLAEV